MARGGEGRKTAAGKGHILRDDGGGLGNGQGTTYGARACGEGGGEWGFGPLPAPLLTQMLTCTRHPPNPPIGSA